MRHEALGVGDRFLRPFGGYLGAGPGLVVCDRFEIVGLAEKGPQTGIGSRIISGQAQELPCTPLWVLKTLAIRSNRKACATWKAAR